jgi:hypothetical protein
MPGADQMEDLRGLSVRWLRRRVCVSRRSREAAGIAFASTGLIEKRYADRVLKRCSQQMKSTQALATKLLLGLVLATAVMSCVVVPDQRHYAGGVVLVAPPPPREEIIGVPPVPGYVWLGGYWGWVGNRHEWVAGRWEAPRPGHVWVPHQWVREGDGWRLNRGHWQREKR